MKQTQFQIAINRPPWTNRFSVISRHTVIKNFDRFWQFIDVAQNTRQNANNRAKTYSWPVQIAKSGQMFVLPSAATFECQDLVAPNPLHFPPTLGARDNLINWKSDDLFFLRSPGRGCSVSELIGCFQDEEEDEEEGALVAWVNDLRSFQVALLYSH